MFPKSAFLTITKKPFKKWSPHFCDFFLSNSPFTELMPVRFLHSHDRNISRKFYHLGLMLNSYFRNSRCWRRNKNLLSRCKIHLEKECAGGSVPDLTSHLFLLLSSSGLRNFKWCLYLYSSGSGEQLWVLMWVKNVPHCKSFHIPSLGRNNWDLG